MMLIVSAVPHFFQICGCCEKNTVTNFDTNGSWWLSKIVPRISTFLLSTHSIFLCYGPCLIKIVLVVPAISAVHHGMTTLHFEPLFHHALNLISFFSVVVKTSFGKAAMTLAALIFVFNSVECGVAFQFYDQKEKQLDGISSQVYSPKVEQSLRDMIRGCKKCKSRLYITSIGSALFLGFVSYYQQFD